MKPFRNYLHFQLVSDNGSQFTSEKFQQFLKRNRIKHITSAPYHPATNGLVERGVGSFINAMKSETEVKTLSWQDFCWLIRTLPTKPVESHHPSCSLEEDYALDWTC